MSARPTVDTIANVAFELHGERGCLCCHFDGAAYHVWCEPDGSLSDDHRVIFKNALPGAPRYRTRKLDRFATFGRHLVAAMVSIKARDDLVRKARERLATEEAQDQEKRAAHEARERARDAGPELLKALIAAAHALRSYEHGNAAPDLAKEVADRAEAAIAQAEGHP